MACSAAAQEKTRVVMVLRPGSMDQTNGHVPWFRTMEGCLDVAMDRARNDYIDILQQAMQKGVAVQLTVRTDDFDVQTELLKGIRDDEVIINFYGALISDTATNKYNCTGALWVGSVPAQLR